MTADQMREHAQILSNAAVRFDDARWSTGAAARDMTELLAQAAAALASCAALAIHLAEVSIHQ